MAMFRRGGCFPVKIGTVVMTHISQMLTDVLLIFVLASLSRGALLVLFPARAPSRRRDPK